MRNPTIISTILLFSPMTCSQYSSLFLERGEAIDVRYNDESSYRGENGPSGPSRGPCYELELDQGNPCTDPPRPPMGKSR